MFFFIQKFVFGFVFSQKKKQKINIQNWKFNFISLFFFSFQSPEFSPKIQLVQEEGNLVEKEAECERCLKSEQEPDIILANRYHSQKDGEKFGFFLSFLIFSILFLNFNLVLDKKQIFRKSHSQFFFLEIDLIQYLFYNCGCGVQKINDLKNTIKMKKKRPHCCLPLFENLFPNTLFLFSFRNSSFWSINSLPWRPIGRWEERNGSWITRFGIVHCLFVLARITIFFSNWIWKENKIKLIQKMQNCFTCWCPPDVEWAEKPAQFPKLEHSGTEEKVLSTKYLFRILKAEKRKMNVWAKDVTPSPKTAPNDNQKGQSPVA